MTAAHVEDFKRKTKRGGLSERERRSQALAAGRALDRDQLLANLRAVLDEGNKTASGRKKAETLVQQLMYPEVLAAIPDRLSGDWLVQLRPAGRRVIASAREGRLTLRVAKNGGLLAEFAFELKLTELGRLTVLDCVLNEAGTELVVMDVLLWDAAEISECEAECRHFWLRSRLSEPLDVSLEALTSPRTGRRKLQICRISYMQPLDATGENIAALYDVATDSLLFSHKAAVLAPGLSPLYLQWRDGKICRFPIDTADATGTQIPARQAVVLKAKRRGSRVVLKTWDSVKLADFDEMAEFPILFAVDESSFLVRGLIDDCVHDPAAGSVQLVNLSDLQRVPGARVFPDSLARILGQAQFRRTGRPLVTLEQLLVAARASTP